MFQFFCRICKRTRRTRTEAIMSQGECRRHNRGDKSNHVVMDRVRKRKTIKKIKTVSAPKSNKSGKKKKQAA